MYSCFESMNRVGVRSAVSSVLVELTGVLLSPNSKSVVGLNCLNLRYFRGSMLQLTNHNQTDHRAPENKRQRHKKVGGTEIETAANFGSYFRTPNNSVNFSENKQRSQSFNT